MTAAAKPEMQRSLVLRWGDSRAIGVGYSRSIAVEYQASSDLEMECLTVRASLDPMDVEL